MLDYRWVFLAICFGVTTGLAPACALAQQPKRVLILDQGDLTRPSTSAHTDAIRAALTGDPLRPIETYAEGLDIDRFPNADHKNRLVDWLKIKYQYRGIDAIIAEGPEALDFAIHFREKLKNTRTPIIFTNIGNYYIERLALPPNVTGVSQKLSLINIFGQITKLLPATSQFVILGDAESQGTHLVDVAREIVAAQLNRQINMMTGMPVQELLTRISSLPRNTGILYLGITNDSSGQYYVPGDLLATLVNAANSPIFVVHEAFLGSGAVGGFLVVASEGVREVAEMTRSALAGEDVGRIPIHYMDPTHPLYDSRALAKWRIPEDILPKGSVLINRELSLWERYSTQIIIISLVIVLQGFLIVSLVAERRRRQNTELRFRQSMSEYAHLSRSTALGELSASIAHELNQPLAAILANAETIEKLIDSDPSHLSEIKDALADIRGDDQRASSIIQSMRSLFKKSDFKRGALNINEIIDEALRFVKWEASSKEVEIIVALENNLPHVAGDAVQLKQVILNLVMNGIDAVQNIVPMSRAVKVSSRLISMNDVEVIVEDSGPGIHPEVVEHIFDPYYTNKSHGMGMGLSISRTIIEAHDSKLTTSTSSMGGACFSFALASGK